jgi:propionate catabolism regulator PrpR
MRYRASENHPDEPNMQHDGEPYSFSLIAPYGNMASLFARYAAGLPCTLSVREGVALEEASVAAREEIREHNPEVILSRGGTADYIQSSVDVPVVSIPTTALDLLRTLHPFVDKVRRVAFFNYQHFLPEVQVVAQAANVVIDEYVFHTREELVSHMIEAKARGAEMTFGGILLLRMRDVCGLEGVLVEAGEAAVQQALNEAFSIARIRRTERQRQARMRTILDAVTEGIIATDESNALTLINPTAEKLLGITSRDAIGLDARDVVPNTRTATVLQSGQAELNDIQDMGGTTIVTNRVPIIVGDRTVGVVCTFSEAGRIQRAEQNLRGSLRVKGFQTRYRLDDIITRDKAVQSLKDLATIYAATDATILLEGESGTGKELFAQGIHSSGCRVKAPFVAVNCAAIPESLLESELFGYEEGAFTGAKRQGKSGFFELAHRGTLFLDEVSELPQSIQARLLRVLQEREIVRVGGAHVIPVDVRIICATNRNLAEWTESGNFRQDLYYRLNVLPLRIPPLRDRMEDIPLLAAKFLKDKLPKAFPFPDDATVREIAAALSLHNWPGNVRELRNAIERLAITASVLPDRPLKDLLFRVWAPVKRRSADKAWILPEGESLKEMTRRFEREAIRTLLDRHDQNQAKVAELLGISRMSLWRKIHEGGEGRNRPQPPADE